jgi:hypothetical protein
VPHLTLSLSTGRPLIDIFVGVSQARQGALTTAGQPVPAPIPARALIDTGASCTCIDLTVLKQLGIPSTGTTPILTPTTGLTPHTVNQYDVSIMIVFGTQRQPFQVLFNAHTMPVVDADLRPQAILALIGRDILATGLLQYNGESELFTLAF